MNNIHFKIKNLAEIIDAEIIGDKNILIKGISDIETAEKGDITFLSNIKYLKFISKTNASAIIVDNHIKLPSNSNLTYLKVKDAYSTFGLLLSEMEKLNITKKEGIEKPNFIDSTSNIKKDVYIGAFSYIGKNVKIGMGTKIFPYTYIGENSEIGDNTIIYPGVKIYDSTRIGSKCIIHANSVIGSDGFGFAPTSDGFLKIEQLGGLKIGKNVEIGANCTIDRGALDNTEIHDGVILDNLVHIAHNVVLGENTAIAASCAIAGSSKIGKNFQMGGLSGVLGHLEICDNVSIGAHTLITKNINEPGNYVGIMPAQDQKEWAKSSVFIKKLGK